MYETEITTNSYNVAKINSVTHTSTLNSITLNVNAQKGDLSFTRGRSKQNMKVGR